MDSIKKSIYKTITWRIVAFIISVIIIFIFIGDFNQSFEIAVAGIIVTTIAYYFHERAWKNYGEEVKE